MELARPSEIPRDCRVGACAAPRPRVSPSAHTHSTRPPVVTTWSPSSAVPAWKTLVSAHVGHVPAVDDVAQARRAGIVLRRHHHAQRRARIPLRADARAGAASMRRLDQVEQVGLQAHHHRLRFRIAEAHVELDHLRRAGGVDHQPGVEEAGERHAVGDHAAHGRLDHLAHHARVHFGRDHRRRRIRAHAAGVRAGVAVADALVVLRGRHRQRGRAVDHAR